MGMLEELFITKKKPSLPQVYHQVYDHYSLIHSSLKAYLKSGKKLLIIKDGWFFLSQCLQIDQKSIFSLSCKIIANSPKVYNTKNGCLNLVAVFRSPKPIKIWFNSTEFNKLSFDSHHTLVAESVINQDKAYVEHIKDTILALINFAIIVAWMSIIKVIFPKFIDGAP
ncbi:hypothetical protein DSO57_1039231 [Entomophthora muscae]|uniref:Uncharacterized protein n=1 Tax=Entomophthora muscae TaxID=34485 RepID=A0ACC2TWZ1_9FUNG|nr:hypothetical protein DSO57_1039231 [Entomophthora muscae]